VRLKRSPLELFDAAIAVVMLAVTEIVVRFAGLERCARWYGVGLGSGTTTPEGELRLPMWARRRLRMVVKVARHWPRDGMCLRQSLVAGRRLRRLGPVLNIGVRRDDEGVHAHAWLSINGHSIDPASPLFTELSLR
jgi:hypothetical protein